MSRPPDPDKRRELARRAAEVMEREGVDMPIAQLADALGVKRPTLLYHFPTRADIVETALEDVLTEQANFVLARMAEHAHPIEQLYAQLRAVHEFHRGREQRMVFLSQAMATASRERVDALMEVGNRVFEPYRRAMAALIREGIEAGTVAPCDPDALVATVRALIDGLMVQRVMTGVELAPVHALIWERLLKPLVLETKKETPCSASTSGAAGARSASRTAASSTKRARTRRA
jgi:AcrR family transcriptional regulator